MAKSKFSLEIILPNGQRFKSAEKGLQAYSRIVGDAMPATELNAFVARQFKNYLDTVALAMKQRHSTPWRPFVTLPSGERNGKLARRSGDLISNIERSIKVTSSGSVVTGKIGTGDLPYGFIHEEGGTISAKRARYLTIPLPAALSATGIPIRQRARDWPNTFVQKSKKGNLIIFQRRGANIVPLYVLKKTVVIPPRLGLGKTIEVTSAPFVDKLFADLLKQVNKRMRARA